jgi:hypothetical protein
VPDEPEIDERYTQTATINLGDSSSEDENDGNTSRSPSQVQAVVNEAEYEIADAEAAERVATVHDEVETSGSDRAPSSTRLPNESVLHRPQGAIRSRTPLSGRLLRSTRSRSSRTPTRTQSSSVYVGEADKADEAAAAMQAAENLAATDCE